MNLLHDLFNPEHHHEVNNVVNSLLSIVDSFEQHKFVEGETGRNAAIDSVVEYLNTKKVQST